jgi:hypothetical protein
MHWTDLLNHLGSLFVIATYSMRTMVPLRIAGMAANCILIVSSYFSGAYAILFLQVILLVLNGLRLRQMLRLIKDVSTAVAGNPSIDWLRPFMRKRHYRKDDVLFGKGEISNEMFFTLSGRYRLVELERDVPPGEVMGELAMLAPNNRRSHSLVCVEEGDALTIGYDEIKQLYFQNPAFGFYFLRLSTARLFGDIERLENELARQKAAVVARS